MSKDTKKNKPKLTPAKVIRRLVLIIASISFVCSLVYVINRFVIAPASNDAVISELRGNACQTDSENNKGTKKREQNWDALKKANKEIVGWLHIDDTPIDYPVLYRKSDNKDYQYYLDHNYKGEYSEYGSIFVDYRCKNGVESKNTVLHGHNMNDGSMFHELINYSDGFSPNLDYFKKHAVISFNTKARDSKWKIFSVFKTSVDYIKDDFFNYMQAEFSSDDEFLSFVDEMRERSMFSVPVDVKEDDSIITLSTCSYEFSDFRTVVAARRLRPGEDKDVSDSKINPSPLYPDIYYDTYGGKRPDKKE